MHGAGGGKLSDSYFFWSLEQSFLSYYFASRASAVVPLYWCFEWSALAALRGSVSTGVCLSGGTELTSGRYTCLWPTSRDCSHTCQSTRSKTFLSP